MHPASVCRLAFASPLCNQIKRCFRWCLRNDAHIDNALPKLLTLWLLLLLLLLLMMMMMMMLVMHVMFTIEMAATLLLQVHQQSTSWLL